MKITIYFSAVFCVGAVRLTCMVPQNSNPALVKNESSPIVFVEKRGSFFVLRPMG